MVSSAMVGSTRPRVMRMAPARWTASPGVEKVIALTGEEPDEWQRYALSCALAEDEQRKLQAFEVALVVPRQNGKSWILEARMLGGVFVLGEKEIIYSAQRWSTAAKAHRSLVRKIRSTPALFRRVLGWQGQSPRDPVKGIKSNGSELSIEFADGARIEFRTRSKDQVRGFTGDLIILDEAYHLQADEVAAMIPTIAARTMQSSPQIWYASSAARADSDVLRELRERGMKPWDGSDPALVYLEWSTDDSVVTDPEDERFSRDELAAAVCEANPEVGRRISLDYVLDTELPAMLEEDFRCERLGIPIPIGADGFIRAAEWARCRDDALIEEIERTDGHAEQDLAHLRVAIDVSPDRTRASVALAGIRPDGTVYVELIDNGAGPEWVAAEVAPRWRRRTTRPLLIAGSSNAADLARDLRAEGVRVQLLSQEKYGSAAGRFVDAVRAGRVAHSGQVELDAAVLAGRPSHSGARLFTWKRTKVTEDITPLVAVTLATSPLWRITSDPDFNAEDAVGSGPRPARVRTRQTRPRMLRERKGVRERATHDR